jgi:2-keto-4-pentenoate hydratase/2-oxohepta-3-ene-1,7-dioic acid hydratase in catechol pathway
VRLVTYRSTIEAPARLGVLEADLVIDVQKAGQRTGIEFPSTMLEFIDLGPPALDNLGHVLGEFRSLWPVGAALPFSNVKLLAPIPRPRKNIWGIGLNYIEHVEESSRTLDTSKELPKQPVIFSKPPTAVIGPGEAVHHNKAITQQLDWEVELAVIIGRTAHRIKEDEALSHVFGYSVLIDVSARDNRRAGQWIYSKGQDTYAPFGPCIVTADEMPDPHNFNLWLTVNGVEKQRSNTKYMLFKVPTLIADIAAAMTLEPGDIIATGTPQGVGAGRNPQEWLWPGDVIVAGVEGIGELRHPIVAI